MWTDTGVTRRLGIACPIIQGPFGGGVSSTRLVATVSNAGGLGCYGANALSPEQIGEVAAEIRALTSKPFAFNLWVNTEAEPMLTPEMFERTIGWFQPYYRELGIDPPAFPSRFGQSYAAQIEAVLAVKPPVLSFVFGVPSAEILRECRSRNIVTIGTATTVDEARALDEAGLDAIVATGFEAGGHRASFLRAAEDSLTGMMALVPLVADAAKAPVIAAGGIADARGIVAALALGAQAVQIGTAFLACDESGAPSVHREMLRGDERKDTALSRVFSGRLARGIRNRFMEEMAAHEAELPPYPIRNWFSGTLRKAAIQQGRGDLLSLQAGQAAALVRHRSAAALVDALVRDTSALLGKLETQRG